MKILVVDDHPLILQALEQSVSRHGEVLVACTLAQALVLLNSHADIRLIIYDLSLTDSTPLCGLKNLQTSYAHIPLLVFTGITDHIIIREVIACKPAGFVPKTCTFEELQNAVQRILAGASYFPANYPNIFDLPLQHPSQQYALTHREFQILELLAQGYSNKQLSGRLGISEHTVRVHLHNIFKKLGVDSRTRAIVKMAAMFTAHA